MPKVLPCYNNASLCSNSIMLAADIIKSGKVIVFPTDTVYGIGGSAFSDDAINILFKLKNREYNKAIVALFPDVESILEECEGNEIFKLLAKEFLPGALTLILKKKSKSKISKIINNNSPNIGVRIPSNEIALKLIKTCGVPIATSSANLSGKKSSGFFNNIIESFSEIGDLLMLNGGNCKLGIESTVLDIANPKKIKFFKVSSTSWAAR